MRITAVQAELYEVPAHREMYDAVRRFSRLDLVLVRVETDERVAGQGFTYSVIPHGAYEVCSVINRSIRSVIHGMDPRDREKVWLQMWRRRIG